MPKHLQKLELTWIGKGQEPKLEPRILIEDPTKSYGDLKAENMLIHGDNLLALKALEQDYAGKVKCIYIDPPYNTGNAFEHYDDGVEHSQWLNLMKPRLSLLRSLLKEDGSIWISIDDDESHYLKVMCDEVFGRQNFVSNVIWEKKYSPQSNSIWLSDSHDHILVYAKNKNDWRPQLLPRTDEMNDRYKNPDNDPRGVWKAVDFTISLTGGQRGAQFARTGESKNIYPIETPSGRIVLPSKGRCWLVQPEKLKEIIEDNRLWFGEKGNNVPSIKRFLSEVMDGIVAKTIWFRTEVGDNQEAKQEVKVIDENSIFATPKPERLIKRVIELATKEGDWVLDSFLGSGTTIAVAHKMNRRWIGIELGEHAVTHCLPRIKKVVKGEDKGGITGAVNWKGGGGFKFYNLAPSLIQKDQYGHDIINTEYNPDMLAAAMAKQEGFSYAPHESVYWKQGHSSEKDFIFTTTQFITVEMLDRLAEEMRPGESLLICCKGFAADCKGRQPHITIKKIPQMLYGRCEFGRDDYSLNIINMPREEEEEHEEFDFKEEEEAKPSKPAKKKGDDNKQVSLF